MLQISEAYNIDHNYIDVERRGYHDVDDPRWVRRQYRRDIDLYSPGISLLPCMAESTNVAGPRMTTCPQTRCNISRVSLQKELRGEWATEAGVGWRTPMIPGLLRNLAWHIYWAADWKFKTKISWELQLGPCWYGQYYNTLFPSGLTWTTLFFC